MPIFDSEEEDSSSSPVSSSNSSTNPQEDHRKPSPLEFNLEAQLLRDIENSGGIHSISLWRLCDLKPFLYGEKNSLQRRRIQNKVYRWKQFKSKEYKQLLCNLLPEKYPTTPTTPSWHPLPSTDEEEESQEPPPASSRRIEFASPLSTDQHCAPPAMLTTTDFSSSANKNVTYIQRILAANEYGMCTILSSLCFTCLLLLSLMFSVN